MQVSCYAVVKDAEAKNLLLASLRHHHTPFVEEGDKVSVEMECVSYRTVEKLLHLFEQTDAEVRGFTLIGLDEEVPDDP